MSPTKVIWYRVYYSVGFLLICIQATKLVNFIRDIDMPDFDIDILISNGSFAYSINTILKNGLVHKWSAYMFKMPV